MALSFGRAEMESRRPQTLGQRIGGADVVFAGGRPLRTRAHARPFVGQSLKFRAATCRSHRLVFAARIPEKSVFSPRARCWPCLAIRRALVNCMQRFAALPIVCPPAHAWI